MSHEFRTPINGIIGMLELALETPLSEEQRDYLELARRSADSLLNIVNQVLDFSSIERGRVTLKQAKFGLRDCVNGTLAAFSPKAHSRGLAIACNILAHVPDSLIGDAYRLSQVIASLVDNAVKFTESGEVVIHIDAETTSEGMATLHFAVTDTGIGIPEDKQKLIFEAFAQADGSITRRHGGVGLGLSTCWHLVELMGGEIWLESAPGAGSAFHFTAPFRIEGNTIAQPAANPALRGIRVLIVDDNMTDRRILQAMLWNWQMKPRLAMDGRSAIQLLKDAAAGGKPYGLILLSALMPEVDGLGVAQHIHQDPSLGSVPVIILSTGTPIDARTRTRWGISASVIKPVMQSSLLKTMLKILKDRPPRQSPADLEEAASESAHRPLQVLLVEDNSVNQLLVVRVLEKQGHAVELANNGREALDAIERERFDLIIMDAQMPVMDGYQATTAIREREHETGRYTPILALTAHASEEDRERCLAAGMDAYISKPILATELLSTVQSLVARAEETRLLAGRAGQGGETATASEPSIDVDAVLTRLEGDRGLLAEVAGLFTEDVPRLLREIDQAIETGDRAVMKRSAHTLRSSLDLFGLLKASGMAVELETEAQTCDLHKARETAVRLRSEIGRFLPAMSALAVRA